MKSPLHMHTQRFFNYIASFLLMLGMITLSGCNVDPSFGYAFAGTWVLLAIAFFIATTVTKKVDHHGHHKKDDKKH